MKRRWLFIVVAVMAGCSPNQLVFVVNHRDYPVRLVYRAEAYFNPVQNRMYCAFEVHDPRIGRTTDPGTFDWSKWTRPEHFNRDDAVCETSFVLPARSSVVIGRNEFCSGDASAFESPEMSPRLTYLRIESIAGIVEFAGWELARQFIEDRGFLDEGECRYDIR